MDVTINAFFLLCFLSLSLSLLCWSSSVDVRRFLFRSSAPRSCYNSIFSRQFVPKNRIYANPFDSSWMCSFFSLEFTPYARKSFVFLFVFCIRFDRSLRRKKITWKEDLYENKKKNRNEIFTHKEKFNFNYGSFLAFFKFKQQREKKNIRKLRKRIWFFHFFFVHVVRTQ